MNEQPEALRIAEWFEGGYGGCEYKAAAELRRLHEVNQELLEALEETTENMIHWGDYASGYMQEKWDFLGDIAKARAAIAKAKEQT